MRIETREQYQDLVKQIKSAQAQQRIRISVCCGPGCLPNGSLEVVEVFAQTISQESLDVSIGVHSKGTGCHGLCERGPLVVIEPGGILYTKVKAAHVPTIIERTIKNKQVIQSLLYKDPKTKEQVERFEDIPFYKYQKRIAMRNLGQVDPKEIKDAIGHGAYQGLLKALLNMTPDQVVEEIRVAGLRGRGGAGFATARKWQAAHKAEGSRKFVLCNGDEGDPGAFKDRGLMEGDPHSVIEGMVVGAYAIGAHEGYIYVRHEYPLAVTNLNLAIEQARELGFLGKNILGSGFDFDLKLSRGGGAFVCGESSALMRSIEGKIGEPRQKYIHATEKGLYDCPTVLNNVETWANVAAIVLMGGTAYAKLGTEKSKGTKAFSLVGKVKNTGLIELPMGMTLRNIIFDIGGGMQKDRPFKAVQTGGPSGGCVPESCLDLPVDYEKLTNAGSMMGSGGMIVMDDRTCMIDVARYFLSFLTEESCGKCLPCREGLKQLLRIYDKILKGEGKSGDIERIEKLAVSMKLGSLCDLGRSAPNPVLSTLQYFRSEYEAHIHDRVCPAGICKDLTSYSIDTETCEGCHACTKSCPADAIHGERKETHRIEPHICIACGACFDVCPNHSILFSPKQKRQDENHANT